ncbi:tetratricopeptide repeat protein [Geminisphaera colitermitum]|uniref:tetratricopeptide repeat protein n=1 Tax=Geminisphaera colitermitum TaxID=1148786 RepID=UPI000158C49A|nr:tetratricopeptide repeat protein [Geminisphaera colitermitum]
MKKSRFPFSRCFWPCGFAVWLLIATGCEKEALLARNRMDADNPSTRAEAVLPKTDARHVPIRRADWRWQNESQFVVESVVGEIASTLAALRGGESGRPAFVPVSVSARERRADRTDEAGGADLTYDVTVTPALADGPGAWSGALSITGAIWDADVYAPMARELARHLNVVLPNTDAGVPAPPVDARADTAFAKALAEADGPGIERINRLISSQMEDDLRMPSTHDRAALLLAVFALRDAAGEFTSITTALNRMAAQITLAEVLGDEATRASEAHYFARAALVTLFNDQRRALVMLDRIDVTEGLAWAGWKRALQTRITGDYRIAPPAGTAEFLLERRERYRAYAQRVDGKRAWAAWEEFPERWKTMPDWFRIVRGQGTSVGTGHILLELGLTIEEREIKTVYGLSVRGAEESGTGGGAGGRGTPGKAKAIDDDAWIAALNVTPGQLLAPSGRDGGGVSVRIIDWGLWADQLQRHLCHTIRGDHRFLMNQWSVPDYAREYRGQADQKFGRLRLYSFAQRENAVDQAGLDKAQRDVIAKMQAAPELVPPAFWSLVRYQVRKMPLHDFMPADDIAAWRRHSPLPGTAYDPQPTYAYYALDHRRDQAAVLDSLLERAPYDIGIVRRVLYFRFKDKVPAEAAEELYAPVLAYDANASERLAKMSAGTPGSQLVWLEKAAQIDPHNLYKLADYWVEQGDAAKAEETYLKAFAVNPGSVQAANHSLWMVNRFEDTGRPAQAAALAKQAGQTWSHRGLFAQGWLLERRGNYKEALMFYERLAERYDAPEVLLAAVHRIEVKAGATPLTRPYAKRLREELPQGRHKVSLGDLRGPPETGMRFLGTSKLLRSSGLEQSDIVVAVRGYRVTGYKSYIMLRDLDFGVPLPLIVWRDGGYREVVTPAVHSNLFGVEIGDYKAAR